VAVLTGYPEALGGDGGPLRLDDPAIFHPAPQLQRLLLAFFLLAADVGDAVIHHLRPALEGFPRAGDRLIGTHQRAFQTVFHQGMKGGDIALKGAVALDSDEPPLGSQPLSLGLDDRQMLGVDLRHHHGHILCPAVGGVVRNDGTFQLGVGFLQRPDGVLWHIHGAETEIHHTGQLHRVRLSVQHHQGFCGFGAGNIQSPAVTDGLPIGLSRASGAGSDGGELEPGMVFQQGHKPLAHHTRTADDADLIPFHSRFLLRVPGKSSIPVESGANVYYNILDIYVHGMCFYTVDICLYNSRQILYRQGIRHWEVL